MLQLIDSNFYVIRPKQIAIIVVGDKSDVVTQQMVDRFRVS